MRFLHKAAMIGLVLAVMGGVVFAGGSAEQDDGVQRITVGVGGWAVDPVNEAIERLGFTEQTGIEVDVQTRPGSPEEFISQMSSAILSGTTPYDVVNIENDAAIPFSRSGWLVDIQDLYDDEFWSDWPDDMLAMVDTWYRYDGELFAIPNNFEAQYFFYRADILEEHGLEVPDTWEELVEVGLQLSDGDVYALSDGLAQGGYMAVMLGYMTQQAGGNIFDFDDATRTTLQFIHDLIHEHGIMPEEALNKDFDQVNADYMQDRVVMMRQWPFFYDVARGNEGWYEDGKAEIALPPAGPAGRSTYAASWGWAIPTTSENQEAAKTFIEFMTDPAHSAELVDIGAWFLSARYSVMDVVGDEGLASYLNWYSEEGVISTRPFHPQFQEAQTIVEEVATAYLTNQISLDEAMEQGRSRIQNLEN
jgi:multiple sugar transport system substrate-binding protein